LQRRDGYASAETPQTSADVGDASTPSTQETKRSNRDVHINSTTNMSNMSMSIQLSRRGRRFSAGHSATQCGASSQRGRMSESESWEGEQVASGSADPLKSNPQGAFKVCAVCSTCVASSPLVCVVPTRCFLFFLRCAYTSYVHGNGKRTLI
jgi:hypothetical protein